MRGDSWDRRERETNERAWSALVRAVKNHDATLEEALGAIQVIYGLAASNHCRRRVQELIERDGDGVNQA